jgi:transposase InsO family protein
VTLHPNAKTTPYTRALMVDRVQGLGWAPADAAQAAGVSVRTLWRWTRRAREEGRPGLADRRSTPQRMPRRTARGRVEKIVRLRRRRLTAAAIAQRLAMPRTTVAAVLRREGLERLSRLEPKPPVVRYERQTAGELVHLDTKKLGRIRGVGHRIHGDRQRRARRVGWEFVHAAVDDYTRTGVLERLPDERGTSAAAFLVQVLRWYRRRGIRVRAVMTDNAKAYDSVAFQEVCRTHGLRHLHTQPYRPRTNGKVERFIQTLLRECAYARPYRTSNQRAKALARWLRDYNAERPHTALGYQPPLSRIRRST